VAQDQAIRLGGWKRGNRVDATVGLEALDLGSSHALMPPNFPLAGRVTLDAHARGSLVDRRWRPRSTRPTSAWARCASLPQGDASWISRRAKAQLAARGLGTELTADVDLPADALRRRKHEPVRARIVMPAFDVAQVVCTAVRMKLIAWGAKRTGPR
jgi:hypothetical protein